MIFKNSNSTVIVTGASSGIGLNISNFLLEKNYNLINIDKKKCFNSSSNYKYLYCDLLKINEIKKLQKILNKQKNIIGLINCAGTTISKETIKYRLDDWNKTLAINLTAAFYISQFVSKYMLKYKINGSIINIASISAKLAMPNNPAYNVSKAGIISLTKSLAVDLAKYNIRVNSVSPGYTVTRLNLKSWNNKKTRLLRSNKTLLKRWAQPNEYNEIIHFLLDNKKSSYVTGSDFIIDGGWTAKGL